MSERLLPCKDVLSSFQYKVDIKKDGTEKKTLLQTVENFCIAMTYDERLRGVCRLNDFDHQIYACGSLPWDKDNKMRVWSDTDDSAYFGVIQAVYGLNNKNYFFDAVRITSNNCRFNPLVDMLNELADSWDGIPRAENLLIDYLGCRDTKYNKAVTKLLLMGLCSRGFEPGIKFDCCLILKGKQGGGKSTFCQKLALSEDFFVDDLGDLSASDSKEKLIGAWLVELGELSSFAKTNHGDYSMIKNFISVKNDKMRLAYDKRSQYFKRTCCFVGTTNDDYYLNDDSGNRRFFPVDCFTCEPTKDIFSAEADKDIRQVWGEIVCEYRQRLADGSLESVLRLPPELVGEVKEVRDSVQVDDGLAGRVIYFAEKREIVCIPEIWAGIGEKGRATKKDSNKIANILLTSNLSDKYTWERASGTRRHGSWGPQRVFIRKERDSVVTE